MSKSTLQSVSDIGDMRARCEQIRDLLTELVDVHLEIDPPDRIMEADEPDWIGRLRKICIHVRAIGRWEIAVDVEHVIAPEIRAAYMQISVVWMCLPPELRLEGTDGTRWHDEARNGLLATYDHPTAQGLMLPAGRGGFSPDENWVVYAQVVSWLVELALGYGYAVVHLSQFLGRGVDIESRVIQVMHRLTETITREDINKIVDMLKGELLDES